MAAMMPVPESNNHLDEGQDNRKKYKTLKRKLKFLLYEQEYFQENLQRVQKKLLRVSRDKSFLLDRLLQYEQVDPSSSDEDGTASSSEASDEGSKIMITNSPSQSNKIKKSQLPNHGMTADNLNQYLFAGTNVKKEGANKVSTGGHVSSKLVPCKFMSNGKQCQELVSKRSKSGYCGAHRTVVRLTKRGMTGTVKRSRTASGDSSKGDTSVDKAEHLESLHRLSESSTASQVPQATEQLPHDVFNMEDDEPESENEDSTGSASFQGNIYEGDDDLVIDIPE
ncbi:uncharacterized protein LOC116292625 [Actinia tenebrosa]|uniref:Uncharacterized protein LOC116292625 n=1 Tax=Actinia tenebrosa TaxID=6105 RepID=A0A6P8HJ07_ACTTE|nr:uncharacterized protein LOC116292625 [Actinia tenebrosa]